MQSYNYKSTAEKFNFELLNAEVEQYCKANEISTAKFFDILLILEELITNIIKYGEIPKNTCLIEINLLVENNNTILTVRDNAKLYNICNAKSPDVKKSAEERDVGGVGILLVRRKAKKLSYVNVNGYNIVTVRL